jgi:5-methylcytosine-specific restriction enzyme A
MPINDRKKIKQDLYELLATTKQMLTRNVYKVLADQWKLSDEEQNFIRSGSLLYQHEIRWAKQELVIEGKILRSQISGRSVWRLSSIPPLIDPH